MMRVTGLSASSAEVGRWCSISTRGPCNSAIVQPCSRTRGMNASTEIHTADGPAVEIIDFSPRYRHLGRQYRPLAFVRMIRPLNGAPRIRIRLNPTTNYGERSTYTTAGSNHIRYVGQETTLRLTTDAPVSHILEERFFRLEEEVRLFLGPDEGVDGDKLCVEIGEKRRPIGLRRATGLIRRHLPVENRVVNLLTSREVALVVE